MKFSHIPVLSSEAVAALSVMPNAWYVDATLGGGGYTVELLKKDAFVLGIDADKDAIECTRERIQNELPDKKEGKHWLLHHGNNRHIAEICKEHKIMPRGIVFDLGVSSFQLDTPQKGFSFRFKDAPLDLRLDQTQGNNASNIIQTYSREDLYEIFTTYGEEERSRAIADAIVSTRRIKPIKTTGQLLALIEEAVPKGLVDEISARIFQALRIEVNDELGSLKQALEGSFKVLPEGGRLAVVSFHSLEDRIVKRILKTRGWKVINKEPIRPSSDELEKNRRSRSAKLRIGEK